MKIWWITRQRLLEKAAKGRQILVNSQFENQASNELLEIKGIKASVVLTDYNNTIYFSARSIDEVNVQVMMEKLGGGGHRTIAGAQMQGVTIEEAKERLKAVIRQMMDEGDVS